MKISSTTIISRLCADHDDQRPERRSRRNRPSSPTPPPSAAAPSASAEHSAIDGRRARDRVGQIEIGDRRNERLLVELAADAGKPLRHRPHRPARSDRCAAKCGKTANSAARSCAEQIEGQPLAEHIGQRAQDRPVLAGIARREARRGSPSARGLRC
ncbi:MAG: hypothetical protein QM722_01515 [Piscinibacter sp.]